MKPHANSHENDNTLKLSKINMDITHLEIYRAIISFKQNTSSVFHFTITTITSFYKPSTPLDSLQKSINLLKK